MAPSVPEWVFVASPNGEQACAGIYSLQTEEHVGLPTWRGGLSGGWWLRSGSDGRWHLGPGPQAALEGGGALPVLGGPGDPASTGGGFETASPGHEFPGAVVRSRDPHSGRWPPDICGAWARRSVGGQWEEDQAIRVTGEALEPPRLFVRSPHGMQHCCGLYLLESAESRRNGFPVWRRSGGPDGERWIYSGTSGHWLIAGIAEKALDFNCSRGHICSRAKHGGSGPSDLRCGWRHAEGQWVDDDAIEVASEAPCFPAQLRVTCAGKAHGCNGVYELCESEGHPNGFPVWRKAGSVGEERWLYSGTDGRWYIDCRLSKDASFDCSVGFFGSAEQHGGCDLFVLPSVWRRGNGEGGWAEDADIQVVPEMPAPPPRPAFPSLLRGPWGLGSAAAGPEEDAKV